VETMDGFHMRYPPLRPEFRTAHVT
jgi:hypothetical protein